MKMKIIKKEGDVFFVQSKHGVYQIKLNPFDCSCPDYKYRKYKTGEFCKHIEFILNEVNKNELQ